MQGTVKWFNTEKGYGFISTEDGSKDVFVHASKLDEAGIVQLDPGQVVTFEKHEQRNGKTAAHNIKLIRIGGQ